MKRVIILCYLLPALLFAPLLHSQKCTSVSQSGTEINIEFTLPEYSIKDTILRQYGSSEVFKYIEIKDFGIIDDIGFPQLPQTTIALNVPDGTDNFQVSISNVVVRQINIDKRIMPTQDDYELNPNFQINSQYYESDGNKYNFRTQLSDPYRVFGESGIDLSIFPFVYNPQRNSISVLKSATITLLYNQSQITPKDTYNSEVKEKYLSNFFENYVPSKAGSEFTGRYLMVTSPILESTLTYFANYKRNIGYDVTVVNTNTTGTTPSSIKNYIQGRYNNTTTRPDFVLLVGGTDDIPAYEGAASGQMINNPITDLGYARLDGDDYFADVFIGRFSVINCIFDDLSIIELKNIINKTIYMEMNFHLFPKKAKFITGHDVLMQNGFDNTHDYVIENTFEPAGYNCERLYQATKQEVIESLNDNPTFFIYAGHGEEDKFLLNLDVTPKIELSSDELLSADNNIYPICFAFSCLTGNYGAYKCFGESWTRADAFSNSGNKGGVAYFGSSVETYHQSDMAIKKKIFSEGFINNERLGQIICLGMAEYYRRFWSTFNLTRTRRYMKAYNLLGDPSLNIQGLGCMYNYTFSNSEQFPSRAEVTYHASNNIQNNSSFVVSNGSEVTLLAGNSIKMQTGFKVEQGGRFKAAIEPCNNGTRNIRQLLVSESEDSIQYEDKQIQIIDPSLFSVFPNPTSSEISVSYSIEETSSVDLVIYSVEGILVKSLLNMEQQKEGNYYYNFSLEDLCSGTYIITLKTQSKSLTLKLIKL